MRLSGAQLLHRLPSPRARRSLLDGLIVCLAIVAITGNPVVARAGLIINEVLANEPGSTTSAEWVELLNWPDTGTVAAQLSEYRYIDSGDTTRLDKVSLIPPGGFVILARKAIGTGSFESIWGDNSGVWGDAPAESYLVIGVAKMALRNSTDTVRLIAPDGAISTVIWRSDTGDGISIERVRPNRGDDPANFAFCRDTSGSTPGHANSVLPLPGDLALDSISTDSIEPRWGEPTVVTAHVTNVGLGDAGQITVELWYAQIAVPEQLLTRASTQTLGLVGEDRTAQVSWEWLPIPGPVRLVARIASDPLAANNEATDSILVRHTRPLVIVSEYLAAPTTDGPDEWVEITNVAEIPINLTGVRLGDSLNAEALPDSIGLISPGEFRVLAESVTRFRAFYPDFDRVVCQISGWRALNNTGDRIRLIGAAGEVIDSLSYRSTYDGNRSTERVELTATLSVSGEWAESVDPSGATPGRANSVVRGEPGRLVVDSVWVNPESVDWGESADVNIAVANVGFGPVTGATLELNYGPNQPASGQDLELIHLWDLAPLAEKEQAILTWTWSNPPPGIDHILARVQAVTQTSSEGGTSLVVRFTRPLVIVSEFMAAPAAGGPGEWIEIYNAANFSISIEGIAVGNADGVVTLPLTDPSLAPSGFRVLADDVTAFLSFYPDFSGDVTALSGWRKLDNAGDQIRLLGPAGEVIDSFTFAALTTESRSRERVALTAGFAASRDWTGSIDADGATPGRANSVVRGEPGRLVIDSMWTSSASVAWGEAVSVGIVVSNAGFGPVVDATLDLYRDLDLQSPGAALEWIQHWSLPALDEGERTTVTYDWMSALPGIHRLVARVTSAAQDPAEGAVTVLVRQTQPLVIVSEFMAAPEVGGPGEWVEIYNAADFSLAVNGLAIGDASDTAKIPPGGGLLPPGAFWVLADDAGAFTAFYPGFSGTVLTIPGWRTLDNTGDQIRLLGAVGEVIDSFTYASLPSENRSQERVTLADAFSTPDDWTGSVDPQGATPGRANSVDRATVGPLRVEVTPNPFFRGAGGVAQIHYRVEIGQQLTLKVYDRSGLLVRTLADDQPAAAGTVSWDGTDDDGQRLRPGPYILLARSKPDGAVRKMVIVIGP